MVIFFPVSRASRFEAFAELNFLAGKQFVAKSANFPKRRRVAENERSRHELSHPADYIPNLHDHLSRRITPVQNHRATARQASARRNFVRHLRKQFRAGMGIRVNKDQPVAGRRRGPSISRAANLIDGFEHHPRACCLSQFAGMGSE